MSSYTHKTSKQLSSGSHDRRSITIVINGGNVASNDNGVNTWLTNINRLQALKTSMIITQ
jgi:hypothetical protein